MTKKEIVKFIDHTLLKPEGTILDIKRLCDEAIKYGFFAVCVAPVYVSYVKEILNGYDIKIATVVGFPLGNSTIKTKIFEAKEAIKNGADEIDMVINIGYLKSKNYKYIYDEINTIKNEIGDKILKVIIETSLLNIEEKIIASTIVKAAGADFVKTSTGFSQGGATKEDVELIRKVVGENFGVKASGGIRTFEQAVELIKSGANRIGTSSSVKIVEENGNS
ncbi:MAG: deoxyribose-phosphate aldolase [Caldisericia bacterium]|jgi:deoxyribose-phosphate aldolase|nr:deoxyribose-phosphate aldolase [Caldisericia bacterium]